MGIFGALPATAGTIRNYVPTPLSQPPVYSLYPTTPPEDIREVVGAAHTQFENLKKMVDARPELAKATWDWGFGDVESALGAASHMGRKDIAEYLISKGARPNIFTLAMLGKIGTVKSIIEAMPGIERNHGPHGFTLLFHAQMRLRNKSVSGDEKLRHEELVDYLVSLGTADIKPVSLKISADEKKIFMGKYVFGSKADEFFNIDQNSRGHLFMSRGDYVGRVLNRIDQATFAPSGGPSVRIHFNVSEGIVESLVIHDPNPILTAKKV